MPRIDLNNAVVCFHRQPSGAFIPFNPWRSVCFSRFQTLEQIYSHTTNTVHTHTQHLYKILAHTQELHFHSLLCVFVCVCVCFYLHGKIFGLIWSFFSQWPWNTPTLSTYFRTLFLCGKTLSYHFILFPLSFVHFPLFFMLLYCYLSFMFFFFSSQCQKLESKLDIYYLTCIKRFVYFPEHILLSDECVFVCLRLQANISRGIYRGKKCSFVIHPFIVLLVF